VVWGHVAGNVLFDSTRFRMLEITSSGFSVMGSRSLLLTDRPAVYIHDTGGFGAPFVAALDPARDPELTVELVERSTRLVVGVRLPDGRSMRASTAAPLPPDALAILVNLRGTLLADAAGAAFVSPCAVSFEPVYEDGPEVIGPVVAAGPAVPAVQAIPAVPAVQAVPPAPAIPAAPAEWCGYLVVRDGRLTLRPQGRVAVEWPVNRVAVSRHGPASVEVRGGAVLQRRFLTGVVLHLVTPRVAEAFLAVMEPVRVDPAAVGVSAPVSVRGLDGKARGTRVDCVLSESAIELQAHGSSTVLASFDLADPRLRVAGSAERFVVFNPEHGPVTVQTDAEVFGRRLHEHPALRAAAERTLAVGPFPAELADGRPVAYAVVPDAVRVKGSGVDLRLPFAAIRTIEGESADARARLRVATDKAEVTIDGQLELVRAAHIETVAASNATAGGGQVADMLRAAVGLEEDYFLYTVFGPFYELHDALLGSGDLASALELPEPQEERSRLAAVLHAGLAELQGHLDRVAFALPSFVRYRDARMLAAFTSAEPAWLKVQEAQLRAAITPAGRAAAETAQLAALVSRLQDLDPATPVRANYTGAAVTLGAAALLNPVFAVSGVSQAYSQYNQGVKRKAELSAQSERAWALVLQRWNTLLGTMLPALGYQLTENLFGTRWEAARRISEALRDCPDERRAASLRAVARRLARLDVMRRYPVRAGIRLRRGEIADRLRTARDAIDTPRFADF